MDAMVQESKVPEMLAHATADMDQPEQIAVPCAFKKHVMLFHVHVVYEQYGLGTLCALVVPRVTTRTSNPGKPCPFIPFRADKSEQCRTRKQRKQQ